MPLPTFDNQNSVQGTGTNSVTIPAFTVGGTERFIFVGVASSSPTANFTTSVVRNGTENFTESWDVKNAGGNAHNSGHYFVNPGAGSFSIVVTYAGVDDELVAGAISLNGVDQGSPVGTPQTAEGSSATASVSVTAADTDLVCDMAYGFATAITVGADQASRWEQEPISGFSAAGSSTQPGTADDVMSWTLSSATWIIGAIPVHGATGVMVDYKIPNRGSLRPNIFAPGLAR